MNFGFYSNQNEVFMNTQFPPAPKVTAEEAAQLIIESMGEYSIEEKIAIRKELDTRLRKQIDDDIQKLQNLRASF